MVFLVAIMLGGLATTAYYIARELLMYRLSAENPSLFAKLRKTHPWFGGITPQDELLEYFEASPQQLTISSRRCLGVMRACAVLLVLFGAVAFSALVLQYSQLGLKR